MKLALKEAARAYEAGEVPVGAVLVRGGQILASSYNLRETTFDPSAHAEILAMRTGAKSSESWRLTDTTLYVTKEPCIMCSGAIVNARVGRVVYGCKDIKAGGVDSLYTILSDKRLNHRVAVISGLLEQDCSALLKKFFLERR